MAKEFKLSYTANEINTRLGKIDSLANKSELPTKTSDLTNDSGYLTSYTETDPTVPAWAKQSTKPSYSKSEVGLGNVDNVKQYSASNPPPYPVTSVNGKIGAVTLDASAVGARPSSWMPSASDVGALPKDLAAYATPQMYGAKGDGTDASSAIQQAINANDYVLIPQGNYGLNSTVTIPSNKKLQIEGQINVNCAVGFLIQGQQIEICGNGTISISSSLAECSIFRAVVDRGISFINICDISLWGVWNYNNSNNHIGVEFVGSSTVGNCCYVNIDCNISCMTKAVWTHEATGQHADSWLTQVDVNSTIQNCLQAIAYEWGGDASRIRGVIQPKCTSGVTPNSVDLPLCILPEQAYMDAMVWDMHAAMNKYAIKVAGQNVTVLTALSKNYMDLAAVVKPTLTLRIPTENIATKDDISQSDPTLDIDFRIDADGNLIMEKDAPYKNIFSGVSYQDGYRINSSGNVVAQSGAVTTGFIPYSDVSDSDLLRVKGASFSPNFGCLVIFYDENRNLLQAVRIIPNDYISAYINGTAVVYTISGSPKPTVDENGVTKIKFNFIEDAVVATPIAYIRIVAEGVGSNLIVTRNEEIVDYDAEGKNLGKIKPEFGVDYFTEVEQEEFVEMVISKQTTETWTFTLKDGSTVTKKVVLA